MKRTALASALMTACLSANAALPASSSLNWNSGNANFRMEVAPEFYATTPINAFHGIAIGNIQAATGSHTGGPDGSESPNIDSPWLFFGNTGMHQTSSAVSILSDDDNGNVTLDMSGWGVTWNGIPNISLSSGAWGGNSNGVGQLTCNTDCSIGDSFTFYYSATVPAGDPSGFGGVRYDVSIEGEVSAGPGTSLDVDIHVDGGVTQECTGSAGDRVSLSASVSMTEGLALQSIEWFVDGASVGTGADINALLALGSHNIEAVAMTTTGESDRTTTAVSVVDTRAPDLVTQFLDASTGQPVTSVSNLARRKIVTSMVATDVCDVAPAVSGSAVPTFAVNNGDVLRVKSNGNTNQIALPTTSISLTSTAIDASGNAASGNAVLIVNE